MFKSKLSFIIPAYNEEANIASTLKHIKMNVPDGIEYEMLVGQHHGERARKIGGAEDLQSWNYGFNQGPIMLMIEYYRSELLWRLMRNCLYTVGGLRRAGFTRGWL